MKRSLIVLLVLVMFLSMTAVSYAATPSAKLARGIANIVVGGICEVPKNIDMEWKASKNAAIGILVGFFKGLGWGVARVGSGLWDVLTFPAAVPANYEPLLKPDLVYDNQSEEPSK